MFGRLGNSITKTVIEIGKLAAVPLFLTFYGENSFAQDPNDPQLSQQQISVKQPETNHNATDYPDLRRFFHNFSEFQSVVESFYNSHEDGAKVPFGLWYIEISKKRSYPLMKVEDKDWKGYFVFTYENGNIDVVYYSSEFLGFKKEINDVIKAFCSPSKETKSQKEVDFEALKRSVELFNTMWWTNIPLPDTIKTSENQANWSYYVPTEIWKTSKWHPWRTTYRTPLSKFRN